MQIGKNTGVKSTVPTYPTFNYRGHAFSVLDKRLHLQLLQYNMIQSILSVFTGNQETINEKIT